MNEVIIKTLTRDRLSEYRNLRFEAIECEPNAFGIHLEEEKSFTNTEIIKIIFPDNGFDTILYAEFDGKMVGMIRICKVKFFFRKPHARIRSFFVKQEFQGNGIGKLLLTSAKEYVNESSLSKKIDLGVVETQKKAISMYESFGFTTTWRGKTKRYYNGVRYNTRIMTLYL